MHLLERILGLSGLTSIVAALAFAVPAQAVHPDAAAVCTVNGFVYTSDVGILTNTGTYTFDSAGAFGGVPISCIATVNIDRPNFAVGIVDMDATSVGTFNNIMCGTGIADSTSNDITSATAFALVGNASDLTDVANDPATEAALDYLVIFAATTGPLVFEGTPFLGNEFDDVEGGGLVHISDPTPTEIEYPLCTTDFAVQGVIAGTLG